MRKVLAMLAGVALLAPASSTAGGLSAAASAPPVTVGCVSAAASFTGEAFCLDGNHADVFEGVTGALDDQHVAFGQLQLNGWQVPTRCDGNGRSGKREQLVYVHVKGEPDIYSQVSTFIKQRLIPGANGVFEHTTAGKRAIRWVTTKTPTGCLPTILKVTVPRSANTTGTPFYNIGTAVLHAAGGVNADRSYLVLVDHPDAFFDCGLGQVRRDASPGPGNLNNRGGAFAMVWANCWTGLVAAHELTHTMGAVQPTAPHKTDLGHCWDGRDDMCYPDGSSQRQRLICKKADDFRKLDCNGDDYFALYPKPGSYLAGHWNSAKSSFLINAKPAVLPSRPGKPTGLTITTVDTNHVRVSWAAGVTKHGGTKSWTVMVGAVSQGTTYDVEDPRQTYPVFGSTSTVVVGGKARSALVAVTPNQVQGFAVYASNASGDGVVSQIVTGGAGAPPTPIVATYEPATYDPSYGTVTWTGGTSAPGVTTCTAVLLNGQRTTTFTPPMSLDATTDPNGVCDSDSSGSYVNFGRPLVPTDLLQVYARNSFGTAITTVAH